MTRFVICLTLMGVLTAAIPVAAQPVSDGDRQVARIFPIRHADPSQVAATLAVFGRAEAQPELGVITVQTSASTMPAVEDALRVLDVRPQPRATVELVATLVKATPVDGAAPAPDELAAVSAELSAVVGTARVELPDRLVVVTTDGGSAELESIIPGLETDAPDASCTLTMRNVQLAGDQERPAVRIGNLVLWTRFALPAAPQSASDSVWEVREGRLTTELSLPVAEPNVIGRAFSDGTGRSVVLVMTARLP